MSDAADGAVIFFCIFGGSMLALIATNVTMAVSELRRIRRALEHQE